MPEMTNPRVDAMSLGPTIRIMWQCAIHGGSWTTPVAWSQDQLRGFLREVVDMDASEIEALRADLAGVVEHEERAEYARLKAKFG